MELVLNEKDFVNDKFSITYGGNREAQFTIVDEAFAGNNGIGPVSKIVILVRQFNNDGSVQSGDMYSSVIGMGNGVVGVKTAMLELRGKTLNRHNMAQCTIILYEDGEA